MRRLSIPAVNAMYSYDLCVNSVNDRTAKEKYTENREMVERAVPLFDGAAKSATWFRLSRAKHGCKDQIIVGSLTKEDLVNLYSEYMVGGKAESRKLYDDIFVSTGGSCPLCGGLGQVATLDHYLPKAYFPVYAVFPQNLIPCCSDCNKPVGASFGRIADDQALNPYWDKDHFFYERWISADIIKGNPVSLIFRCSPPSNWTVIDQNRARKHFVSYSVSRRFSVLGGAEIAKTIDTRKNSLRRLSSREFREYLLDNANASGFDLNGWSRTTYAALAENQWFCAVDFNKSGWETT